MGYFYCGTAGVDFQEYWCRRCVHYGPEQGPGCCIWGLHLDWNYSQHDDTEVGKTQKAALDALIEERPGGGMRCKLFHEAARPAAKETM